ncbi:MAG: SMP-30/gluconolactonase/LRE family protein [Phycisphaerae bacterium]|nr:SMP-30/gluconolactonase/LRE family protein [Phycisphaerae bacterium]HON91655.1 SMP-30/gluconolactonase/LRE family protein [Sedimentisphaerales bacterium]
MIAKRFAIALVLVATVVPCVAQENTQIVAAGAQAKKLAGDFKFTEGPAADAQGNVYFTDIPANLILKWSVADGKLSTFLANSGGANGLYFDKDGNLLACQGGDRRLVSISPKGEITVLADKYEGKRFNSPNDLWIDPNGGVYFTDPRYGNRDGMEIEGEHVYYLTPDRKKVIRVIDDMVRPNGVIGTPNGRRLYVADHGANKTYSYRIASDGTLSDKQLFAEQGSDGLAIDARGNVYLTGKGIAVYSRQGEKLTEISVPEPPANLTFGGADNQTLFITARTSLYSIPTEVRGARTPIRPGERRGNREGRQRPRQQ